MEANDHRDRNSPAAHSGFEESLLPHYQQQLDIFEDPDFLLACENDFNNMYHDDDPLYIGGHSGTNYVRSAAASPVRTKDKADPDTIKSGTPRTAPEDHMFGPITLPRDSHYLGSQAFPYKRLSLTSESRGSSESRHISKDSSPLSYSAWSNIHTPDGSRSDHKALFCSEASDFFSSLEVNSSGENVVVSNASNASYSLISYPSSDGSPILNSGNGSEFGDWTCIPPFPTNAQEIDPTEHFIGTVTSNVSRTPERLTSTGLSATGLQDSVTLHSRLENVLEIPVCLSPVSNYSQPDMPSHPEIHMPQRAKRKRDGNEETNERRAQTLKVREKKACLRCRIYKEKCDLMIPCGRCSQVYGITKLFNQPCQRLDLMDVIPFRTGNARMGQKHSELPKFVWSGGHNEYRFTSVTHLLGGVKIAQLPKLRLRCREFKPTSEHNLFEHYESPDDTIVVVQSPPFACIDIPSRKIESALSSFIQQICPFAIDHLISTSPDEIYRYGLIEAKRLASNNTKHPTFLTKALEILSCVYVNFSTPVMTGDTLDVELLKDKRAPTEGRRPIPSVLDFQLDTLYIHHMTKLIKAISRELKKVIFSTARKSRWYEIFMTVFVLLVSIEQVYLTQCKYLQGANIAKDQVNIFAKASPVSRYMLEQWRASAKNLLYHYRCIMNATLPFSPSFNLEDKTYDLLDTDAKTYIRKMAALVREREAELLDLRDKDLDNSSMNLLSWISKLFID